jgi:hypothetical protein
VLVLERPRGRAPRLRARTPSAGHAGRDPRSAARPIADRSGAGRRRGSGPGRLTRVARVHPGGGQVSDETDDQDRQADVDTPRPQLRPPTLRGTPIQSANDAREDQCRCTRAARDAAGLWWIPHCVHRQHRHHGRFCSRRQSMTSRSPSKGSQLARRGLLPLHDRAPRSACRS